MLESATIGGGLHTFRVVRAKNAKDGGIGQLINRLTLGIALQGFTPVEADSMVFYTTLLAPKLSVPVIGPLAEKGLDRLLRRRNWGAIEHDLAVLLHRSEPENPPYGRLDRSLVRFRRFWDSRLADRSLVGGDGVHANGRRAGTRWEGAAVTDAPVTHAGPPETAAGL